jgi:superfamily II DNA helicase RecQ
VKAKSLMNNLKILQKAGRLGRFVIDEAHCVSTYGNSFREDYKKLGLLKKEFPNVPLIALTATATPRVVADVIKHLNIDRNYEFFRTTANRPNLTYSVVPKVNDTGK